MKKRIATVLLLAIGIIFVPFLSACGGGNAPAPKPTPSLEIDYAKINGDSAQSRMDSLVSLLNSSDRNYAKITYWYREKVAGEKADESGVGYTYVLMVYGDLDRDEHGGMILSEINTNKMFLLTKQLVAYTVKFVADRDEPNNMLRVLVIFPTSEIIFFRLQSTAFSVLRNSPTESWLQYTEMVPMSIVPVQ